jgi:hypothetical protein
LKPWHRKGPKIHLELQQARQRQFSRGLTVWVISGWLIRASQSLLLTVGSSILTLKKAGGGSN